VLLSAGWWVAIVALWPAGSRPFIDGSPDNSILNLIVGYNGLGRIFASSGPGGGGGGVGFSGATGPLRLFNELMGGQASWLLPAALIALVGGLWARRRAPRTDRTRAALLLWGGWLIVTAAVFSFGQGVIHTYYTVALAPAIGALIAIGAAQCWSHRDALAARLIAALAIGASAGWAYALLERTPSWEPWLRPLILLAGALGVLGLLLAPVLGPLRRRVTFAAAVLGVLAATAGPIAYAADTITTPHRGSIPSAGPASAGGAGMGAGMGAGLRGLPGGTGTPGARRGLGTAGGPGGAGLAPSASASSAGGAPPGGPATIGAGLRSAAGASTGGSSRQGRGLASSGTPSAAGNTGSQVSAALVKALQDDAGAYRWVAATWGSQSAATLELASDEPVMAIGGFNNEGGRLSLAAFERYVADGDIHYYIASTGGAGGPGGGGSTSTIASWVAAHFTAQTIGGETVYDLAQSSG
jgi:hypothetical protein